MAERTQYEELVRQLSAFGVVKREMSRIMPADCHSGSAAALALLGRHGDMRMSKLADLLSVDLSVTSRHVTHLAERGWIERSPDPADKRSRILRLTPAGQEQLDELFRRTTQLLAERLGDWPDEEIGRLTQLMARLRDSFGEGRATARPAPPPPRPAPPALERTTRTPADT
ncbi:MarR family transcriptional regulator [Streptomyces griseomycini]|uniref:MarR family winged helix-turn-helix transcriptional regulator n=1 Tax=Streptomyces griseomycini TaxID=66895 RepID=UPI0018738787|nr:MarR family transcriptional regulator [Streptomyces griseomycini]GGQ32074.1 MarR family transcriptional regulator [Streptomyces griseomycini]